MSESIQIVEIQQRLCVNTYGTSPCTASGPAALKCYNTLPFCQDTANYSDTGNTISLFFTRDSGVFRTVEGAEYLMGSLVNVADSPAKVNIAAQDRNTSGFGLSASMTLQFKEFPHTDFLVDPYLSDRDFDPAAKGRGGFWSRWIVRNRFYQNYKVILHEGVVGDALADMTSSTYFIEKISGPDSNGQVTMECRDLLARFEKDKTQIPEKSRGVLQQSIGLGATEFEVNLATTADYPVPGKVRIGDEIISYTTAVTSANGVTLSGGERAVNNTTASTHDFDSSVQLCFELDNEPVDTALAAIMEDYATVDGVNLDTTGWATEIETYRGLFRLTGLISTPTPVAQVVGNIAEQVGFYFWWDLQAALLRLKAVRGADAQPDTLSERFNIVKGSFSLVDKPDRRAAVVVYYYNRDVFTGASDDPNAYKTAVVPVSSNPGYDENPVREVYAQFITSRALAESVSSAIITRYAQTPREATFTVARKDGAYEIGDQVLLDHDSIKDQFGANDVYAWTIVKKEPLEARSKFRYTAEETRLIATLNFIMADATDPYDPADDIPFKNAYIGDADGLLSDGTPCAKIG